MGACADQEESFDLFAAIVRSEPRALKQLWLKRKRSASVGQQALLKINRCEHVRRDDRTPEAWQNGIGQTVFNRLTIGLGLDRPVDATFEVRYRREYIKAIAPGGCHRGIGGGRPMQIETEIFRKMLTTENVFKQPFVSWTEYHRVMKNVVPLTIRSKVPNEETHRPARSFELAVSPAFAGMRPQKLAVSPTDICVGDYDLGVESLSTNEFDATSPSRFDKDLVHLRVAADVATLTLNQGNNSLDQCAHPTHRIVHPVQSFQVRNQAIVGSGRQWIAANQQRMETECHPQSMVGEVVADFVPDITITLQANHVGGRANQRA